ncbi:MAG TPA: L,D-transpeptidase family protein, partial [Hyphomicrobiaceae bacterium]|nr:L,D-transpeptidase family protein [Hyphomicrobiaceae bacterium]
MTVTRVSSRFVGVSRHFLNGAAVALVLLSLAAGTVQAEPRYAGDHGSSTISRRRAEAPRGPLLTVVSLAKQRVLVYGPSGLVAQSPVSTGMAGHRTPAGVFSILQKSRHHRSNIYSNAPMPYMQRLTWSGIALHAGVLPGYPASHGCIRMPHEFASELWRMIGMGSRVVVVPDDPTAVPIEHARLPSARLLPAPVEEGARQSQHGTASETEVASATSTTMTDAGSVATGEVRLLNPVERAKVMKEFIAKDAAEKTKAAHEAVEVASTRAAEARRAAAMLDAAEESFARTKRRHESAAEEAAQAAEAAARTSAAAARAAEAAAKAAETPAVIDLTDRPKEAAERAAERALARAERGVERAREAAERATTDAAKQTAKRAAQQAKEAVDHATDRVKQTTEQADMRARDAAERAARRAKEEAEHAAERAAETAVRAQRAAVQAKEALDEANADLGYAQRALEEARLLDAMAGAEGAAAQAVATERETARREAELALKVAKKAGEPISIFVSKKAGKVRVRQGWLQIHEAPVTFTEGAPILGTHVYLAMGQEADGETMRWLSVSLPSSRTDLFRSRRRGGGKAAPAEAVQQETAKSVL